MKKLLLLLTLAAGYIQAVDLPSDVLLIAINTNAVTQGQATAFDVFKGEHFPPAMLDGAATGRQASQGSDYTDGTNTFRVYAFSVYHLETPRRVVKYEPDGVTVKSETVHGRPVTAVRIAGIREPFDGVNFKIERIPFNTEAAKLAAWGLAGVVVAGGP